MKRVTNTKTIVGDGDTIYRMDRLRADGNVYSIGRRFPKLENRSRIAYVLREARRDLLEAGKPDAERWFKTDDRLPTSGVVVEAELYGAVIVKLSYSRGFWYNPDGRVSLHSRPTRWRYLPEGVDA